MKNIQSDDNIKVYIRIRPPLPKELQSGHFFNITQVSEDSKSIEIIDKEYYNNNISNNINNISLSLNDDYENSSYLGFSPPLTSNNHRFSFDYIFNMNSNQQEVYNKTSKPLIDSVLKGYNSTIFCYGQTSSGKTYTMTGPVNSFNSNNNNNRGIIQRAIEDIFEFIDKHSENNKFVIKASYLQIYNENINDLLINKNNNNVNNINLNKSLNIREDKNKGIFVENLSEWNVNNVNDVGNLLKLGMMYRNTSPNYMNEYSSRSHAVFSLIIEQMNFNNMNESDNNNNNNEDNINNEDNNNNGTEIKISKINFVDLAGSERTNYSSNNNSLEESKNINKSLHCLSNVIYALSSIVHKHVPYRDSKLTRLLENSLGGNCKTTIISTINPSNINYYETLSTLNFSKRAKTIKNSPKINVKSNYEDIIKIYENEIKKLKLELDKKNNVLYSNEIVNKLKDENFQLEKKIKLLNNQIIMITKDKTINNENNSNNNYNINNNNVINNINNNYNNNYNNNEDFNKNNINNNINENINNNNNNNFINNDFNKNNNNNINENLNNNNNNFNNNDFNKNNININENFFNNNNNNNFNDIDFNKNNNNINEYINNNNNNFNNNDFNKNNNNNINEYFNNNNNNFNQNEENYDINNFNNENNNIIKNNDINNNFNNINISNNNENNILKNSENNIENNNNLNNLKNIKNNNKNSNNNDFNISKKENNNNSENINNNKNKNNNNNNNYKNKILENKKMLKNNSQNNIHKKEIILSPNNNQYISFLKEKILNLENKNKQLQKQLNTLNLSIISNEKTYFPFLYEINNFSKTNIQPIKLLNSEEKILELRNIIKDYEKKIYFLEIINQNKLGNYENNKKIFNNIDFNNFKDKINELYDDKNYLINKINDQNFIINTLFKQVNLYENIQQNLLELKQNFGNLNKSIFYEKIENIENIFKDDKYKNIIKNYMNNNNNNKDNKDNYNNENNNDNYNDINNDEKQIKKITNISIHYNNI